MTDLNALAERLDGAADFIGDHDMLTPDLRQAAQALRGMGEALKAIDDLCTGEIKVRFGTGSTKTEAELARGSKIYPLLVVPRNIARSALKERGGESE